MLTLRGRGPRRIHRGHRRRPLALPLSRGRFVASVGFAALVPVALVVVALVTIALVAAIWLTLHAYELIWFREERARRRADDVSAAIAGADAYLR